jgi:hypothetical protein
VKVALSDHSKRANRRQRAALRAVDFVDVVAVARWPALPSARQVEIPGEDVSRIAFVIAVALGRSQVVGVVVAESGSLGGVTIPEHYARDIVERRGDRVHRLKNARENGVARIGSCKSQTTGRDRTEPDAGVVRYN